MKMRSFKPSDVHHAKQMEALLKSALHHAKAAKTPMTARKIRSALKSAGGAMRHLERAEVHSRKAHDPRKRRDPWRPR